MFFKFSGGDENSSITPNAGVVIMTDEVMDFVAQVRSSEVQTSLVFDLVITNESQKQLSEKLSFTVMN